MFDAIVLAGGSARRLDGVAKPQLRVGGITLIDRVLAAVADAGTVLVVGPQQPTTRPVRWCHESPVGGGPVAAVAAAFPLTSAETVVLLAADLPFVAPAVRLLLDAVMGTDVDVARLVDAAGRANHLVAAWRRAALGRALAAAPRVEGAAMRALAAGLAVVEVADPGGWGSDCDTWDDLRDARALVDGSESRPGTGDR